MSVERNAILMLRAYGRQYGIMRSDWASERSAYAVLCVATPHNLKDHIMSLGLNRLAVLGSSSRLWPSVVPIKPSYLPFFPDGLSCESMEPLLAAHSISQGVSMTSLRQRMTEDMQVRNLALNTQCRMCSRSLCLHATSTSLQRVPLKPNLYVK
jgi:hypothetical protein